MVSFRVIISLIIPLTVFTLPRLSREAFQQSPNESIPILRGGLDLHLPLSAGKHLDSASSTSSYPAERKFQLIDIVQDSSILRRNIPRKLLPSVTHLPNEDDTATEHDRGLTYSGDGRHGESESSYGGAIVDSRRTDRYWGERTDGRMHRVLYDNTTFMNNRTIYKQNTIIPTSKTSIGSVELEVSKGVEEANELSLVVHRMLKEIAHTRRTDWQRSATPSTSPVRPSGNFETGSEQFLDKPTITASNLDSIVSPPTITLSRIYNDVVLSQSLLNPENGGDPENSYISVNQSTIWTPEVIAGTLALMPIILSISMVCVMVLFMLLHCFTPKEITHVTNNTYTTKLYKSSTSDRRRGGPRPPMDGPASITTNRNQDGTFQDNPITQISNFPTEVFGGPSHNNHCIPQAYRSHHTEQSEVPLSEPVPKRWHHGLLNMWNQEDTSWEYPLSSVEEIPACNDKNDPTNRKMDPTFSIGQELEHFKPNSTHIIDPITGSALEETFARGSLTTGLQDIECGRETLRYRRTGMRDNWLSNLFFEKIPGTQNIVIVEQLDGIQRGASIGGARRPERSVEADIGNSTRKAIPMSSQIRGKRPTYPQNHWNPLVDRITKGDHIDPQFHSKNSSQAGYLTRSLDTMGAEASSDESRTPINGKAYVFDEAHFESPVKQHSAKINTYQGPRTNRIVSGNHATVVHPLHTLPKPEMAHMGVCSSTESQQGSYERTTIGGSYVEEKVLRQDLVMRVDGPADSNSPETSTHSVEIKLTKPSEDSKASS